MSLHEKNMKARWRKWKTGRDAQKFLLCVVFMAVPVVLLILFTYYPFAEMFRFSFYRMKYIGPRTFIGLDNYRSLLADTETLAALKNSLYYMVGAVIQLAIALFFASILSFKTVGRNIFKGILFFPYLLAGIAVGYVFKFFFAENGVLDSLLLFIGFSESSLPSPSWLSNDELNNYCLVFSSVWRYMGQNMVLFIGAIMSVDPNLYEAAEIDGANNLQRFFHIILPGIKTIVMLNLILAITGSLAAFEPPYVITQGGMGTATYFVRIHNLAQGGTSTQKVGKAAAMAIVLFTVIIIATVLQKYLFKYLFKDNESGVPRSEIKADKKATKEKKMAKRILAKKIISDERGKADG